MKNAEPLDLPLELDRRLKQGVEQLREMRETLEELDRVADAIRPLLGLRQGRARATSRPATRAAGGRMEAAPPPAQQPRGPQGREPSAPASTEELPAWRKLFPKLSAEVPGRAEEPKKKNKGS